MHEFAAFDTPDVSDLLNRLFAVSPAIQCLTGEHHKLVGPICTVKVHPADNLMVHKSLDIAQPGDVVVIDAGGTSVNATLGNLVCAKAQHRGIAGFVIDGYVRDLPKIKPLDFPVFARGATTTGPLHHGPGEINYPICCGGVVVNPGDVVVADAAGVVIVPRDHAADLLVRLRAFADEEPRVLRRLPGGQLLQPVGRGRSPGKRLSRLAVGHHMAPQHPSARAMWALAQYYRACGLWHDHGNAERLTEDASKPVLSRMSGPRPPPCKTAACDDWAGRSSRSAAVTCVLRTRNSLTSLDDPVTLSDRWGQAARVSAPRESGASRSRAHVVCAAHDLTPALQFVRALGRPCVVKPAEGPRREPASRPESRSSAQLIRAMARAGARCHDVIVEEQIDGDDLRLLYLDGELLDAIRRLPPTVRGDGSSSIEQLIEAENADRLRNGVAASQTLLTIDWELRETLRDAGVQPGLGADERICRETQRRRKRESRRRQRIRLTASPPASLRSVHVPLRRSASAWPESM